MSAKKDGGAVFPWGGDLNECPNFFKGISKRDYFAAAAMQGEIMAAQVDYYRMQSTYTNLARFAYLIADAMLKERDK
tara:strand:- start:1727 stop:1957 length:231 start_codon:yes stop_codon:yes gene_type:complete